MDRVEDGGRRVKRIERRSFGAVVFVWGQERLEFPPQFLPACILKSAADGFRKDREGNGAEAAESGQRVPFLCCGRPLLLLDLLERTDGREYVPGLGLLADGDGR